MPKLIEANCVTNEVVEREMTEADTFLYKCMTAPQVDLEAVAKEQARQSALTRLRELGLTDIEITALGL